MRITGIRSASAAPPAVAASWEDRPELPPAVVRSPLDRSRKGTIRAARRRAAAAPQATGRRYQGTGWAWGRPEARRRYHRAGPLAGAGWAASASTAAARRSWRPGGSAGSSSTASRRLACSTDATTSAQDGQPARWASTSARWRRSPSPAWNAASCSRSGWSGTLGYSWGRLGGSVGSDAGDVVSVPGGPGTWRGGRSGGSPRHSARARRPRKTRLFTVPTGISRIWAASA
jgi:hypothetical protein